VMCFDNGEKGAVAVEVEDICILYATLRYATVSVYNIHIIIF
jgi:hypothetical protein